ncbi:hypothetical protein C5167_000435, partial [Papaver somniferum]
MDLQPASARDDFDYFMKLLLMVDNDGPVESVSDDEDDDKEMLDPDFEGSDADDPYKESSLSADENDGD